jgi:hypothetical protein
MNINVALNIFIGMLRESILEFWHYFMMIYKKNDEKNIKTNEPPP